MQVITAYIHTYIHYSAGADELAIMHRNRFSPSEDFFVNPFSSVLTIMQDIIDSSIFITKSSKEGQETSKYNLKREYRDCIKSRRDKIRITRHIIMHQVLYIVQLPMKRVTCTLYSTWCIL